VGRSWEINLVLLS